MDGLLTAEDCDQLRCRMAELVDGMDVPEHCRITFSTDNDQLKDQVQPTADPIRTLHYCMSLAALNHILNHFAHMLALCGEEAGKYPLTLTCIELHNSVNIGVSAIASVARLGQIFRPIWQPCLETHNVVPDQCSCSRGMLIISSPAETRYASFLRKVFLMTKVGLHK